MRFLPHLIFAASLMVAPVAAFVSAPPPLGAGPYLVLLPPWEDADDMVKRADGWIVGPYRAPFAVLATTQSAPTGDAGRGFSEKLKRQGAWAVRHPGILSSICGVEAELNT